MCQTAVMKAVQVENEEIEIAGCIGMNGDENRMILDSYAVNECQDDINGSLINKLSFRKRDEVYKFQTSH